MVVGFTNAYAISAYHHWCCEFESRSERGIQHYVIKFVSDLRQVGGFLRFPPPIKLTVKHYSPCHNHTQLFPRVSKWAICGITCCIVFNNKQTPLSLKFLQTYRCLSYLCLLFFSNGCMFNASWLFVLNFRLYNGFTLFCYNWHEIKIGESLMIFNLNAY